MLSYAFRVLNEARYQDIMAEEFENTADLMAAILAKGAAGQIKRGLGRDYVQLTERLSSPKGKIDISAAVKERAVLSRRLVCISDSYEENTYMNQILKSTAMKLVLSSDVKSERKKELKKVLFYFSDVDTISLNNIKWAGFQYTKSNATYRMLINICELVIKGLLLSDDDGKVRISKYINDRQMYNLYEKFILEYYKKHYPELHASASQIEWDLDDGYGYLLPAMKSDIMLQFNGKITIIDAKYYSRMLQYNQMFQSATLHSSNIYQIFTYVKNKDKKRDGSVSGVLLYAKTESEETLNQSYMMGGNKITVKSIDLGKDFSEIRGTLDDIAMVVKEE